LPDDLDVAWWRSERAKRPFLMTRIREARKAKCSGEANDRDTDDARLGHRRTTVRRLDTRLRGGRQRGGGNLTPRPRTCLLRSAHAKPVSPATWSRSAIDGPTERGNDERQFGHERCVTAHVSGPGSARAWIGAAPVDSRCNQPEHSAAVQQSRMKVL
jgi:hypothetical protein